MDTTQKFVLEALADMQITNRGLYKFMWKERRNGNTFKARDAQKVLREHSEALMQARGLDEAQVYS